MVRNASTGVIGISQRNPHYFQYKGQEILLITSAEVYGAVVNKKFDCETYLNTLHDYGFNYTRIYPGAFVAKNDMFGGELTLAPEADLIVPWARSDTPGYVGGGNKFDLDRWDPAYFARLKDFIRLAAERDIIVEMCFFNAQYPNCLEYSPLHQNSNIQGVGSDDDKIYQYMDDPKIFAAQLNYVEKLITETNGFDNMIYEFIDEPTLFQSKASKAYSWISALIDKAVEVEEKLPKKHMLAQQLEFGVDFCDDDRVSIITSQYIEVGTRQIGGLLALDNVYCYEKPIEMNETALVNVWYTTEMTARTRLEAWEFMVGGGAAFNQLNGYFTAKNPSGTDANNREVLEGLRTLRKFMESFDYAAMTRDLKTVQAVSRPANINVISESGKQYVMYMHHSHLNYGEYHGTYYTPAYGEYAPVITMRLEKGSYAVTFIEPETLRVIEEREITCGDGETELNCPRYSLDIAIQVNAK